MLTIHKVLDTQRLEAIRKLLDQADFVDGKLSAGKEATRVKHNQEIRQDNPLLQRLNQWVMMPLVQHPQYQAYVLPLRVASPFFARYTQGMSYGLHVDDPVMGPMAQRYRSDISTTVFLNAPDEYEGGELVMRHEQGEQRIKLAAGDAIVYPSTYLHEVAKVTSGVRLVAVAWAQSMVKSPEQRALLFELSQAREQLLTAQPENPTTSSISNVYSNLVRMWAEV